MVTPRGHAAFGLALLSEDEAQQHVEASNGKQEKGRDESKVVDMVRENGGTNSTWRDLVSGRMDGERRRLQALHHAEWAQTKVGTKYREESVEKCHRPPNLGEDERNDLEDD